MEEFVSHSRTDGVQVETLLDDDVSVPDAIVARAHALAADLIVVGAGGTAGAQERPSLGYVTNRLLRSATCSLLVIPTPGPDAINPCLSGLRRIFCAVSFSDASREALTRAAGLSEQAAAHLSVVHVVELFSEVATLAYDFDEHREVRVQPACEQLDALVGAIIGPGRPVEEIVADGDPRLEIVKLAHDGNSDLIVMAAQMPRTALTVTSTVEAVTRDARCPVLLVSRLEPGAPLTLDERSAASEPLLATEMDAEA
jgi:nucleotide-binding universal stress UspA family protein